MPGAASCARCNASLRLQTAAVEVYPPRAGALARTARRWFPWRRFYYPLRDIGRQIVARPIETGLARTFDAGPIAASAWLRMAVPGWAQCAAGQRWRGRAFFAVWIALLAAGIMCFGATPGSMMLGFAFSVHIGSVLDVLAPRSDRDPRQIVLRALVIAAPLLVLYLPIGWGALQLVGTRQWQADAPPFAAGDVILYSRRAYNTSGPAPGDVVLFRDESRRPVAANGHARVYQGAGDWVDRVLAVPGSTVSCRNGELLVDGRPSAWRPLNANVLPDQPELRVPEGMYYIVPSTNAAALPFIGSPQWRDACLHPRNEIIGKVLVRHYPIWRWWWLRSSE
jgi:hypothetical protein